MISRASEYLLHPEKLFDVEFHELPDHHEERWWVLHTHPRAEKALARKFLQLGLSFFLPLYERVSRSSKRPTKAKHPLFPGYIFLRGDQEARLSALKTNQIVSVLPVVDQNRLHSDLRQVYHLVCGREAVHPVANLEAGQPVRIIAGGFAGFEGMLVDTKNGLRFCVEVQFLKQGVSIEVERWMLHPLGDGKQATQQRHETHYT
ncbi:MAG: transcription termination/antitermination NusG family protein [Gemmataceae bacterium]